MADRKIEYGVADPGFSPGDLLKPFAWIGGGSLRLLAALGRSGYLARDAVRAVRRVEIWMPLFARHLTEVGVASIPLALFILAFTGVVLAIQASYTFTGTVPLYFVGVSPRRSAPCG